MGFDPPFAESAEFTEWKTDALANQATIAGWGVIVWILLKINFDFTQIWYKIVRPPLFIHCIKKVQAPSPLLTLSHSWIFPYPFLFVSSFNSPKQCAAVRTCFFVIRLPTHSWSHLVFERNRPRLTNQGWWTIFTLGSFFERISSGTPQSEKNKNQFEISLKGNLSQD